MFKRMRLMSVSALVAVLMIVLVVAPSSAEVPTITVQDANIECGTDGYLLAQVTVIIDIGIIEPIDLRVYVYPFADPTGQPIGEVDMVITEPGTYVVPVPLNRRPGGPEANIPDPIGFNFSAGAEITVYDPIGDFINFLGADFRSDLYYTPPDCNDVPPPPPPAEEPVEQPTIGVCARQWPVLSSIIMSVNFPQVAEWGPAKGMVTLASGEPLVLPHDYNNDGADEYLVLDAQTTSDDTLWLGVFVGGCDPVYIRAENVTFTRPLP